MKKCAIALLLAASSVVGYAQDFFDNPDNKAFFGVRASYELAVPGDFTSGDGVGKLDALDNGSGFNVGAVYNMPVWKNLFVETGLSIYYNTYSLNRTVANEIFPVANEFSFKSASVRQWGFRLPIHAGYNFDFTPDIRVGVFTGPELNVSFKGNTHAGVDEFNISGPAFGDNGYLNRADIKWRIGASATFMDHYYVAISGAVGMCDMARDLKVAGEKINLKMRSNVFDITFGYNF
ncbi:MAG: outer membrane beta-barrel protein [Bacteroides sp.]|nr:outer membrane beta-barrel protein [Bacteroides sp.]MCM1413294.1 outer membrane beta-barrel protein [Bacteroides sp.]MCM1471396.1 outer membrane beta-barrel protein [Bacteroides sp.]